MDIAIDGSNDNEEDFHSASDSPSFHGDPRPSAALLAVHLAVAFVHHHRRARLQSEISVLPVYPVGLPPLTESRRRYTQAIIDGKRRGAPAKSGIDSFQRLKRSKKKRSLPVTPKQQIGSALSVDQFPSVRVSHEGGYQLLSSDSDTDSFSPIRKSFASTDRQPWGASSRKQFCSAKEREKPWIMSGMGRKDFEKTSLPKCLCDERAHTIGKRKKAIRLKRFDFDECMMLNADEDDANFQKRMHLKEDFQWVPSEEHQLERSPAKQELEAVQDGESLACGFNMSSDKEGSSCILNHRTLDTSGDEDDDDMIGKSIGEIVDMNTLKVRKLSDDSQHSSILSNEFLKARPCGTTFTQQDKARPWSSDIEFSTLDDRWSDTVRDGPHISGDGAAVPNSRVPKSSDFEGVPAAGPEQGQFDSLLLWPVGLAVEAIAFQVRLIVQAFSLVAILFSWCNSFASNRVRETLQAKERATEALNQKVAMISNVPPKVTESGSMVLRRAGWGCCAAVYVCILLSMLLFPTLVLDYVFVNKIVEEPVSIKEPLHFDYTLPHPTAVVFLHPSRGKFARHSEHARRPIPVGHKVHITVFLTLPESDYNRELGMFQLSVELLSETGQIIESSSRSCMLRFYSLPIRMLKIFLLSLPSLMGMFTESQTLVVHLMEFEEQHVATSAVRILVQPKAGMPLGQGIPEIYSADVLIETHLPWLKNLMRSWKWTVYIWTGVTLYVVQIIMILCCCRQALVPKALFGQNDEIGPDKVGGDNPVEGHENGLSGDKPRREQGPTRHSSLEEHIPTARAILHRREHKLSPGGYSSI